MNINLDFISIISKYDRETILDTIQSLVIITNRCTALAGIFDSTPELKEAKSALSGITSLFTIRSTFNSTDKIFQNFKKEGLKGSAKLINALETAAATIGIESGIIGITRTLATFKLIDLEQFSSALGNIPVFQTLGHVSSGLAIITSAIGISIESIKIHDRSKKIDRLKDKALAWTQPLDLNLVQRKIATHTQKHDALVIKTEALATQITDNQNLKRIAKEAYIKQKETHKNAKGLKKIKTWKKLRDKKSTLKKLNVKQLKIAKELNQMNAQEVKSFENLTAWNRINTKWDNLTAEDDQMIAQFQANKTAKWEGKTKSMKIEQIKAAVGLGLKVVGLIMSIAAFILSLTGVGVIPVLATMATISLVLALSNLGFSLFKRHTSPMIMEGVQVPLLAN